jgi:2-succinyl-6-hydroxy-2,4-cyclohexadiene-1-carboxylate synthase
LKAASPISTEVQELVRKVQAEQNQESAALSLESFGTASMPYLDSTYFKQITCPVLFIAGQQDSKFADKATELTSYNPLFSKEIIPTCGHRVHLEKTSEYLNLIKVFIYDLQSKHKR